MGIRSTRRDAEQAHQRADEAGAALAALRAAISAQTDKPASFYVALAQAHKQDSEMVDEHEEYGEVRTLKRERDEADEALAACRAVATGKIAQARDWLWEIAADHPDSSLAEWCEERAARLDAVLKEEA